MLAASGCLEEESFCVLYLWLGICLTFVLPPTFLFSGSSIDSQVVLTGVSIFSSTPSVRSITETPLWKLQFNSRINFVPLEKMKSLKTVQWKKLKGITFLTTEESNKLWTECICMKNLLWNLFAFKGFEICIRTINCVIIQFKVGCSFFWLSLFLSRIAGWIKFWINIRVRCWNVQLSQTGSWSVMWVRL